MAGFKFQLKGLKPKVLADLPKQRAIPNSDQSFMGPLADFIAAEIDKMEQKFTGVMVIASGEFSKETGRTTASIQIYGEQL